MEENEKEILQARDQLKVAIFRLMDLDPRSGWQIALQEVYDARWQHEARKAG